MFSNDDTVESEQNESDKIRHLYVHNQLLRKCFNTLALLKSHLKNIQKEDWFSAHPPLTSPVSMGLNGYTKLGNDIQLNIAIP